MRNTILILLPATLILTCWSIAANPPARSAGRFSPLPPANLDGAVSVEQAIAQRRSIRRFDDKSLTAEQLGQLCWAGQGITEPQAGFRSAPSAGALYPIELYLVTREGIDHYRPKPHALERLRDGDHRTDLQRAALGQETIGKAPLCVVISAVVERTARKYGDRAKRYCLLEAGHVAQNILLQATADGLAGVPIGAFEDDKVRATLGLPEDRQVLYLLAIGHKAEPKTSER